MPTRQEEKRRKEYIERRDRKRAEAMAHEKDLMQEEMRVADQAQRREAGNATRESMEQTVSNYLERSKQQDVMDMLGRGDPRAEVLLGATGGSGSRGSSSGGGGDDSGGIRDAHRDIITEYEKTQNVFGKDTPSFQDYLNERLPEVAAQRGLGGGSSFADRVEGFNRKQTQQAAEQAMHTRDNVIVSKVDAHGRHVPADQKGYRKFTLGGPGGTPTAVPEESIIQTGLRPAQTKSEPEPELTSEPIQKIASAGTPKTILDHVASTVASGLQKAVPLAHKANQAIFGVDDVVKEPVKTAQNINRFLLGGQSDPFSKDSLLRFSESKIGKRKYPEEDDTFGKRVGSGLRRRGRRAAEKLKSY